MCFLVVKSYYPADSTCTDGIPEGPIQGSQFFPYYNCLNTSIGSMVYSCESTCFIINYLRSM